jgi:hypothetical protein
MGNAVMFSRRDLFGRWGKPKQPDGSAETIAEQPQAPINPNTWQLYSSTREFIPNDVESTHLEDDSPSLTRRQFYWDLAKKSSGQLLSVLGVLKVIDIAISQLHPSTTTQEDPRKLEEITESGSPRHTKMFNEVYDALVAKIPKDKHSILVKPKYYVEEKDSWNASHAASLGNEKSFVAITSKSFHGCDDDELKYLIGHELGHWLCRFDKNLAKKIAGFDTNATIQSELNVQRVRIQQIIPDAGKAKEVFERHEEELIADAVSLALSCSDKGLKSFGEKSKQSYITTISDYITNGEQFSTEDEKKFRKKVAGLVDEMLKSSINTHPERGIRRTVGDAVMRSSVCVVR